MDSRIISNLEEKIDRAVELIRGLRNEKEEQEKEKDKLRHQLSECRKDFEEYKKSTKLKTHRAAKSPPAFDSRVVKERLKKLAGKLAALEDSWN
jgi:FtsZ-binding cell division protein ZapB